MNTPLVSAHVLDVQEGAITAPGTLVDRMSPVPL